MPDSKLKLLLLQFGVQTPNLRDADSLSYLDELRDNEPLIRSILAQFNGSDRIRTATVASKVLLDQDDLSARLRACHLGSTVIRFEEGTFRGFYRQPFLDAVNLLDALAGQRIARNTPDAKLPPETPEIRPENDPPLSDSDRAALLARYGEKKRRGWNFGCNLPLSTQFRHSQWDGI